MSYRLPFLLSCSWCFSAIADEFAFDPKRTALTDIQFDEAVSGDKQAVTVSFDNFNVELTPKSAPVVSRVVSFVLATKGSGQSANLAVTVHGSVGSEEGASALVVLHLPGMTEIVEPDDYAGEGFEKTFKYAAEPGESIPVTVLLAVERKSGSAQATLTLDAIDIGIPVAAAPPSPADP